MAVGGVVVVACDADDEEHYESAVYAIGLHFSRPTRARAQVVRI